MSTIDYKKEAKFWMKIELTPEGLNVPRVTKPVLGCIV